MTNNKNINFYNRLILKLIFLILVLNIEFSKYLLLAINSLSITVRAKKVTKGFFSTQYSVSEYIIIATILAYQFIIEVITLINNSFNFNYPRLVFVGVASLEASPNNSNSIINKDSKESNNYLLSSGLVKSSGLGVGDNNQVTTIVNKKLLNYKFTKGWNTKVSLGLESYGVNNPIIKKNNDWYLPENLNKIISAFFKSIYCLISKPKFIHTADKIIIEILYYITIPDHNIFKWYNFIYNTKNYNIKETTKNNNSNSIINRNSNRNILKKIKKVRRNKSIKTILLKNFLIKKTLFNLNNSNIAKIYLNKFTILFKFLSSYFGKPIEFNLIRIHKSDYEVNILAQLFILILKKKNIRIAINKLYNKNNIGILANNSNNNKDVIGNYGANIAKPIAIISGLYIHIGGRLMREPIIPRLTTKKFEKGAIATGKVNFLDSARITKKNKKGAYTIKIAYAQNLVS